MAEIKFSTEAITDLQQTKAYITKKFYANTVRRAERQLNTIHKKQIATFFRWRFVSANTRKKFNVNFIVMTDVFLYN